MYKRLTIAWFAMAILPVLWLAPSLLGFQPWSGQSDRFLRGEDLSVLIGLSLLMASLSLVAMLVRRFSGVSGLDALATRHGAGAIAIALGLPCLGLVIAWAGSTIVFGGYPLSRDEDMAGFGAAILAHGQTWARVAPEWRAYAHALQPEFVRLSPGAVFWQPDYLPVNSTLRAMGGAVGLDSMVSPLLAMVSVLMVFAIGRRLWPERPGLALIAGVLLATSSQALVTAMTSYAMTAHLALNLVWLWLFMRGGRPGHAGALFVGFLACGLHQLAFHALFAAPFVLQLWLQRRWWLAGLYTLAYAAICLFWTDYAALSLAIQGGAAPAAAGTAGLGDQVAAILQARHPPAIRSMAENLIRFITWQNPLTAPLALFGLIGIVRGGAAAEPGGAKARDILRPLAGGLVLTTLAVCVLMPYQGFGWGYRYWHGLLGSVALIGALGWGRLTRGEPDSSTAAGMFAVAAALSLLVLLPVRALQARAFVRPYAAAAVAIHAAPAGIVLVDTHGGWFTADLVRNDPYLAGRPLVMRANGLRPDQLRVLCARYALTWFDSNDAAGFGITSLLDPAGSRALALARTTRASTLCGPQKTPIAEITARR